MQANISIDASRASSKLNELIVRTSKQGMNQVTGVMLAATVKSNQQQFNLEGNGQYKPLNKAYKIAKLRKYGNKPILVATGKLKKSVSSASPAQTSIRKHDHNGYTFGTRLSYAKHVNAARPVIFHRPEDKRRDVNTLKAHFLRGLK